MSSHKYTIGITGGSGYIGSSLASYLAKFYNIKLLDIKEPKREFDSSISYSPCDIRNYKKVEKALKDVDLVIHAAIIQIPLINEEKRLGYEVNIVGTQNVCRAVDENPRVKGMILASSWHTIGESELEGVINEEFGFRPDKVEDRARLYALSKIAQESIVRFYDEMSEKIFAIIRMGTVLGEGMPEKTAANIFIERALRGETITPYKHSMYRPMLYVDIEDVCCAYRILATKILNGVIGEEGNSLAHIVNFYYPRPITILDLAEIVQKTVAKLTNNAILPKIEIIDTGEKPRFTENDKNQIKVDLRKVIDLLGINKLKSPEESIEKIVEKRITRETER